MADETITRAQAALEASRNALESFYEWDSDGSRTDAVNVAVELRDALDSAADSLERLLKRAIDMTDTPNRKDIHDGD